MYDDSQSPNRESETRHRNVPSGQEATTSAVTRRSCLKLAGSAAAFAAAGATPAAGASYDTITVPSNTKKNIYVGTDEVWENKLIDITASGASVQILPEGNNWTVRNVGIRGVHPGGHRVLTPYVPDHNSVGVVENFYAGDGQIERTGSGFCWVQYEHRGTIEFRNMNVQHFVDNALYTTSPGDEQDHTHGRSHIYDSYLRSNNIANCRTGAKEGTHGHTCEVHRNTIVVDSTVPPCEEGCSSPGAQNSRAVWAVNGGVEVKDCDVQVDTSYGSYFETLHGGYYTNDPWADNRTGADADTSIPDCVPTSASDAASGADCESSGGGGDDGDGTGDTSDGDEHLEVVSVDGGPLFTYQFTVKGSVSLDTSNGDNSADSNDSITDNGDGTYTVSGEVGNGYGDAFYYDGNILDWSADTDASNYDLYNDGTVVSTTELVADVFEIVSVDGGPLFTYSFGVSDNVSIHTSNGDNSGESSNDSITDDGDGTFTVSGEVGNGYGDSFYFDGDLSNWSADTDDSNYNLYVNGSEIQPSDIGGDGGGSSATVVDDFEDGDISEYSFDRGSTGASVVSSPTHSGSYVLEYTGTSTEAISTSGLNAYPSAGDTISFWVRGSGGAAKTNLSYGVQDHTNRYFVRVNVANDSLALYRYEAGSGYEVAADWSTPTLSQDAWYEVRVQWATDGTHTVTLLDASGSQVAQITGTDSMWASGGVGFDAYLSSGQYAYFDDVTIK